MRARAPPPAAAPADVPLDPVDAQASSSRRQPGRQLLGSLRRRHRAVRALPPHRLPAASRRHFATPNPMNPVLMRWVRILTM